MSDFMRTAAERYTEPTPSEQALMRDLLAELDVTNARTDTAMAALEASRDAAAAFDEDACRAKVREELLARNDIDWSALSAMLAGKARQ
jgi:hypothetical protein